MQIMWWEWDSEAVGFFYWKSRLLIHIIVVTVKYIHIYIFINLFAMQPPLYLHKLVYVPTLVLRNVKSGCLFYYLTRTPL